MVIISDKKRAVEGYLNAVAAGDADAMAFVTDDYVHEFIGSTVFAAKKRNIAGCPPSAPMGQI